MWRVHTVRAMQFSEQQGRDPSELSSSFQIAVLCPPHALDVTRRTRHPLQPSVALADHVAEIARGARAGLAGQDVS